MKFLSKSSSQSPRSRRVRIVIEAIVYAVLILILARAMFENFQDLTALPSCIHPIFPWAGLFCFVWIIMANITFMAIQIFGKWHNIANPHKGIFRYWHYRKYIVQQPICSPLLQKFNTVFLNPISTTFMCVIPLILTAFILPCF